MSYKVLCFLVLTVSLSACQKLDELTHFNLPLEQSIIIPANSITGVTVSIPIGEFETNLRTLLDENDSNLDQVEQIFIESMSLEVETPSGSDLDYFENISIYLTSETSPSMKVAWKEPVPVGINDVLDLEVWDTDMKSHFTQNVVNIRVDMSADKITTVDQTVNFKAVFKVNAKVLGV